MPKSAAEATPPAGNRFVEFDEFIDYQLTKTSRSIQSTDILFGVVGAALGLTAYLFLFILADHWLVAGGLGTSARLAFWLVGVAALGYWVATRLIKPFNSRVNVLFAARQIERTQPGLKSSLLTLTDLRQSGRPTSAAIRGSLEKRAAVGLSKADVDEAIDRSALMTLSYTLLFLLATFCGYALFSPKSILQSAWRAFAPLTQTGAATRTRIDHVKPGNAQVPALSHLDVEVEVSGQAPEEAILYYTTTDRAFVDEPVPLRETGEGLRRYRGTLIGSAGRGLQQSLTYFVVAGDARSQTYSVTVTQSPSAVVETVAYEYLPYTGLAAKEETGGAIDAWEGTRVVVHATANQRVKSAVILFSDSEDTSVKAEELPMIVSEGTKLRAGWQLAFRSDRSFPKFYRVQLTTEDGHQDPLPTLNPLNIRPDLPPRAEIVFPKSDLQAPVNGVVTIAYRASDPDFKLRSMILHLEHDGQILASSPRLFAGPPDEESREGTYTLRLKELNLAAGSRLTYWLEARDNFEAFGDRGPNRTLTPRLNIDLVDPQPTAQATQQEAAAQNDAQEALREAGPDQGRPAGAEEAGGARPDQPQDAGRGAPSEEPMPGAGQKPGTEKPGEQPDSGDNAGAPAAPGQDSATRPGEQPQVPGQPESPPNPDQPAGTPPQPGGEDRAGEKQEGDQGAPQGSGQQQKPGQSQTGPQGERDSQTGNRQDGQPGGDRRPGSGEKAPDDTALKKLLEWAEKQPQSAGDNLDRPNPGEQPPSSANDPQTGRSGDEQRSPEGKNAPTGPEPKDSASPTPGQDEGATSKPGSTDPAGSKGDAGQPGAMDPAQGSPPGMKDDASGKPGEEPLPDSSSTKPDRAGEKPADAETKGSQPDAGADPSSAKPAGDAAGESAMPGEPGAKPDPQQDTAGGKSGTPGETGDKTSPSPAGEPGAAGEKSAGEKTGSSDPSNQKPGAADAKSTGQESPTGESGDRTQPGRQNMKPDEQAGNSAQPPAGQSNDQGTREGGAGEPGASSPGDSGGQKTSGPGEAGQSGESSTSGQKSGTGQSRDGRPGEQAGAKPGEPGSGDASKPGGGERSKPGQGQDPSAASGEQPPRSPDGKSAGGDQKSGGAESPAGDQGAGGRPDAGGEQPADGQPGGQQAGDQPPGGDQKGGEQGGQSQGGGEQGPSGKGSSGEGASPGDGAGAKPGSQAGSQPGMGGGSGSGPGEPSADGASGTGQSGGTKADPVDLEHRKKATNLALKRLQETLERGEIDPELQKELNFTDDELRSFMDRLQERLADNGDDNSPEAQARRRQFESLLKGINLQTETSRRAGGDGTGPAATGFGAGRRPAPREYQAAEQKYRESLSGRKGSK